MLRAKPWYLPAQSSPAIIHVLPLGEERRLTYLRHYTARLRHSRRLRYRIARSLALLPIVMLLYAIALARF